MLLQFEEYVMKERDWRSQNALRRQDAYHVVAPMCQQHYDI